MSFASNMGYQPATAARRTSDGWEPIMPLDPEDEDLREAIALLRISQSCDYDTLARIGALLAKYPEDKP